MNKVILAANLLLILMFAFSCSSDSNTDALCSGEKYDTNVYRCEGGELVGKCRGKDYYPANEICNDGIIEDKFGFFTDSRDKQKYKWVKIGNQTWMAENLKFNAKNSECPKGKHADCEIYGRTYDWSTATSACPGGWHLPSKGEWTTLIDMVGEENAAKMKAKNEGGSDEYGFSALGPYATCEEECDGDMWCLRICSSPGGTPLSYFYWWATTGSSNEYADICVLTKEFFFCIVGELTDKVDKGEFVYVRCIQN